MPPSVITSKSSLKENCPTTARCKSVACVDTQTSTSTRAGVYASALEELLQGAAGNGLGLLVCDVHAERKFVEFFFHYQAQVVYWLWEPLFLVHASFLQERGDEPFIRLIDAQREIGREICVDAMQFG